MKPVRIQVFETRMNWRQVRDSIINPNSCPSILTNDETIRSESLTLFLPIDRVTDVRTLRDWLHDSVNVNGKYTMLGRYEFQKSQFQSRTSFVGLVIAFERTMDAVHFRLFWEAQAIAA